MTPMIVRAPRPTERFTIVDNVVIDDDRLSFRALGLLITILSKPDNWRTDSVSLSRSKDNAIPRDDPDHPSHGEGREAVRTALRDLEACGYLVRTREQIDGGRWRTVTMVFDSPQPVDSGGDVGSGCRAKPQVAPTPKKLSPDKTAGRTDARKTGARSTDPRKGGALPRTRTQDYDQRRPVPGKTVGDPTCDVCQGTGMTLDDDGRPVAWCRCSGKATIRSVS
jgi:hypothetical protein